MRGFGDLGCRPVEVWTSGLLDAVPPTIDHAVVGAAAGLGRNGWGGALLLRDVSEHLVPEGDAPLSLEDHRQLLDHLADLSATFWGAEGTPELLSLESRWSAFGPGWTGRRGGTGLARRRPPHRRRGLAALRRASARRRRSRSSTRCATTSTRSCGAVRQTPLTFLHGDWKLGNLGVAPGRTVLLDWTYPGIGPIAHDLAWYLALNRARLPETKEASIDALRRRRSTSRGIATDGWWDAAGGALPARRARAVRLGEGARRRRRAAAGGATAPARGRAGCEPSADAYSATGAAWQRGPERVYQRLSEVLVDASPDLAGRAAGRRRRRRHRRRQPRHRSAPGGQPDRARPRRRHAARRRRRATAGGGRRRSPAPPGPRLVRGGGGRVLLQPRPRSRPRARRGGRVVGARRRRAGVRLRRATTPTP